MGSLFKHGGGGKTTENKTENQESWLQRNPAYQQMENNALNEANNFNMPNYQLAGENDYLKNAIQGINQGFDISKYNQAGDFLSQQGQNQYTAGQNALGNYQNILNKIGNMSQSDYQSMMQNEFNNDLVNQQVKSISEDINNQYLGQVQQLNEAASSSGNMGNSRAGVAQGVMAGQADKAIGNATVQYRTQEEQNAYNRVQSYLSNVANVASTGANINQNLMEQGLNMYQTGMNFYNAGQQVQQTNYQNRFQLGQWQQQQEQNQLDVARQNQILQNSPALTRLSYFNQVFLPMEGLGKYGSSQTTTQTPGTGGSLFGGILGTAGAVVGGIYGGPAGAALGGQLGGAVGNSF